ncbi:hypothetical protein R3O67_30460 [Bacillus cereus]|uniref:hypothetical protein n=1 Tax=Bacillus cereus TaxID=1396 RepID=UPI00307AE2A3
MKKLETIGVALTIVGLLVVILVAKNEFDEPKNIIEVKPQPERFQKESEKLQKNPYGVVIINDDTKVIPYQPESEQLMWLQWYK